MTSLSDYIAFHVTGVLPTGRRFKRITASTLEQACSYNIWQGKIWGVRADGSRRLLKSIYN